MKKYQFTVNTDSYICHSCSKKNWEPGTKNDYMLAINGTTRSLRSLREVEWQLELFRGNSFLQTEYSDTNPEENHGLSDRYVKFLKKNTIKYYDRLCKLYRTQYLSAYGFALGYVDIDEVLKTLKGNGTVQIPFSRFYDIRQYDKNMNGCYIKITINS